MASTRTNAPTRGSWRAFRRVLWVSAFLPVASRAPSYTRLLWALVRDERIPQGRKALLAGALTYLVVPGDLIPDDVPLVGGLDDLVVLVLAVDLFLEGVPPEILGEKLAELGLDPGAFDRDIAQLRRLMPRPVRRLIRRIPEAAGVAARAVRATGIGPRVRAWITEEGSLA